MRLNEWLDAKLGTKQGLADACGVRWQAIHDVVNGATPRLELALAIERATDGRVTTAEMIGPAAQRREQRRKGEAAE